MKEGDVVVVVGKLDYRIRDQGSIEERTGTIVWIIQDEVVVLLKDNILWRGPKRDVCLHNEQQ